MADFPLTADFGSFTLTGDSVGLRTAQKVASGYGSLVLAGQSVGLRVAKKITAARGLFTLTGFGSHIRKRSSSAPSASTQRISNAGFARSGFGG